MLTGEDIIRLVKQGAADALNLAGDDLGGRAMAEAPVEEGELRASCRFPSNDPESRASDEKLEAQVSFNTPYAAAQHEGQALQHRQYAVKPITVGGVTVGFFTDKSQIKPHTVMWVVKKHPGGGKSHFLSDPFKAMIPRYEAVVAANVKKKLEEGHGAG